MTARLQSAQVSGPSGPYLWLASYPKSGNTWVRLFLHAYRCQLSGGRERFDINATRDESLASRKFFANLTGLESSLIPEHMIASVRYRALLSADDQLRSQAPILVKTHDQFRWLPGGTPLVPACSTRGVVYLVRNPLDIAPSLTHHFQQPIDRSVAMLADADCWLSRSHDRQTMNLPTFLGRWSDHVSAWLENSPLPTLMLRYEDLLESPAVGFSRLIRFANIDFDAGALEQALQSTSFEQLKRAERTGGFRERPKSSSPPCFFRRGRAGDGARELADPLQEQIRRDHGPMMTAMGYT